MIKDLKNNLYIIKYVFKLCPKYIWFSLINIIFNCIGSIAKLMTIELVVEIVVKKGANFQEVLNVLLVYFAIIIVTVGYNTFYNGYIFSHYHTHFLQSMQHVIYTKVRNVDYADFDNPEFYDRYSRAIRSADYRGIKVYEDLIRFLNSLCQTLAIGSFIVLNDYYLIIIIVIAAIINVIVLNINSKLQYNLYKDTEKYQRMYHYVNRTFYQQRFAAELKTTPISDLLIEYYNDACHNNNREYIKVKKKTLGWNVIGTMSTHLLQQGGTYVYLGWKLIVKKTLSISSFTSTLSAATQFCNNFTSALSFFNLIKENSMYISDIRWFMEYEPSLELQGTELINGEFEELNIKNIVFSYPNTDFNSIDNINLKIKKGQKLAIVGLNGAGKTTLMKLLLKFYNPNDGVIEYNGVDIKGVEEANVRSKYSIIFQDYRIYAVSIAENVLMRKCTKDDEKIVKEALDNVGLLEKIESHPDGIYALVTKEFTSNGIELSGGEAQRLAIARVFASNADIYVLDEPTSALDPFAERKINQLILEKSKDKTIIIIAHRLSTVVDTDEIILIEKGRIVERGNHKALLNQNGKYALMFNTQAELYRRKTNENK